MFSLRSVSIETLGEAWRLGWRLTARCAFGNRDGMKSIRQCIYRAELDMQTLVWTRGPNFPLTSRKPAHVPGVRIAASVAAPQCAEGACSSAGKAAHGAV